MTQPRAGWRLDADNAGEFIMESAYHLPCQDRIRKVPGHRIQVSRRFAHQVTALTQPYDPTRSSYPRDGPEKASCCVRLSQKTEAHPSGFATTISHHGTRARLADQQLHLPQRRRHCSEVVDMTPRQSPLTFCWSCATSNKTESAYAYRPLGLALTPLGFVLFPKRQR